MAHKLVEKGDVGEGDDDAAAADDNDGATSDPDKDDESIDVGIEEDVCVGGRPPEIGPDRRVKVGAL